MDKQTRYLILAYDIQLKCRERIGAMTHELASKIASDYLENYPCVIVYEQSKFSLEERKKECMFS